MPQPDQVLQLAAALLEVYRDIGQRLSDEQRQLVTDWPELRRSQRLARLRELEVLVATLASTADEQALRWVVEELPSAYLMGAVAVTGQLAGADLAGVDLDALAVLAADTYSSLLAATDGVRDNTKQLVRFLTRQHVADKLLRGDTAVQAARDLTVALEGRGVHAVAYADGSRHRISEYAQMIVRTKTAEAYSTGNLAAADASGVDWVEVFDGPSCGWRSHADPDKANGTVRRLSAARQHRIAHPNCTRAFGARPDIDSAAQAAAARPSATPAQNIDQQLVEQARELAVARRAARRALAGQIDRRTAALLAEEGQRVVSDRTARRAAGRRVRLDRQARQRARDARLARRTASRDTTDG